MTVIEKIQKHRAAYIMKYRDSPKSIILGYEIIEEIKKEIPLKFIAPGAQLYGMKIIRDNNKPTRVEAGDLTL